MFDGNTVAVKYLKKDFVSTLPHTRAEAVQTARDALFNSNDTGAIAHAYWLDTQLFRVRGVKVSLCGFASFTMQQHTLVKALDDGDMFLPSVTLDPRPDNFPCH